MAGTPGMKWATVALQDAAEDATDIATDTNTLGAAIRITFRTDSDNHITGHHGGKMVGGAYGIGHRPPPPGMELHRLTTAAERRGLPIEMEPNGAITITFETE